MFNKPVIFIYTFIHSHSQYKSTKYPEYCKVGKLVKRLMHKKINKRSEFCET